MNFLKEKVPWWIKMVLKITTGKLGLTSFFLRIKIFDYGKDGYGREFQVFNKHFSAVKKYLPENDFVVLELGPGYSISSAVFTNCFGGKFTYLVDQGDFVGKKHKDKKVASLLKFLENKGIKCNRDINYKYLTNGLKSLKEIPSSSVNFVFSNAVLEHIKKDEFIPTIKEIKRVLQDGGVCSHEVDLRDHLGRSLSHLRFSEEFWERDTIYNSGFYTNRLRFSEMIKIFKDIGFKYEIIDLQKFRKFPISKSKINSKFKDFSEDDLLVSSFQILLFRDEKAE